MFSAISREDGAETQPLLALELPKQRYLTPGVVCILLLALGVFVLAITENWDVLISAYALTQIVTTIGYGDYTPDNAVTKLFMIFYAIIILVVVSYVLNGKMSSALNKSSDCIVEHLVKAEEARAAGGANSVSQRSERSYQFWNQLAIAFLFFLIPVVVGAIGFHVLEGCTCDSDEASNDCVDATYSECVDTGGYTQSWLDSFYLSVITLSTIGFGDYYPRNQITRFFCIIWMLVGVACTALFLDKLSHLFFADEMLERLQMADELMHMDYETFQEIDSDHNGYLTRGEFLSYSLIKYADVKPEVVRQVLAVFDAMEKSRDGKVTWDEITYRQQQMAGAANRTSTGEPAAT